MIHQWNFAEQADQTVVSSLAQAININPHLSNILVQRGIKTFEEAKSFFRPSVTELHDPFLMKDMYTAVSRLKKAINNNENILIYGDYDVDGTCSVALIYNFLKTFHSRIGYYIPDRYDEGYGVSEQGIRLAADNEVDLIVCLDCGIRANKNIDLANSLNIDFIVCDHHLPSDELPNAFAILDPKQTDCLYPYKELCGCGVGFKLLQAFCLDGNIPFEQLLPYLAYVSVATAADIVPITGENRTLCYFGLQALNQTPFTGLNALIESSGKLRPLSITDIVFGIAPRINAAGRIKHALYAVEILIEENHEKCISAIKELEQFNTLRKTLDKETTLEALNLLKTQSNYKDAATSVIYKKDWHKGVIGIVASRCIEKYYRPTIILTSSNGKVTGSARSIVGFDVHSAIEKCSSYLEQFGGHKYAAGLTLTEANVDNFSQEFEKVVSASINKEQCIPILNIDFEIPLSAINTKFFSILQQMGPFGPQNMEPVFITRHVRDNGKSRIVKEEHLKLHIIHNETEMSGIAFNLGHYYEKISNGEVFDICYTIDENTFRGHTELQLMIKDIKTY